VFLNRLLVILGNAKFTTPKIASLPTFLLFALSRPFARNMGAKFLTAPRMQLHSQKMKRSRLVLSAAVFFFFFSAFSSSLAGLSARPNVGR